MLRRRGWTRRYTPLIMGLQLAVDSPLIDQGLSGRSDEAVATVGVETGPHISQGGERKGLAIAGYSRLHSTPPVCLWAFSRCRFASAV